MLNALTNVCFWGQSGHDSNGPLCRDPQRTLWQAISEEWPWRLGAVSSSSDANNQSRQGLGGPSLVGSVDVARQLTTHIEFENSGNHDNGLRPISILEHCKPERLSTIDEESAAEAARVPNHPVSSAVLANEKQRRSRTRGRLDLCHAILRDSLNDGL